MPIQVYLYDAQVLFKGPQTDWTVALQRAFGVSLAPPVKVEGHLPPIDHPAYKDENAVLFIHSTRPDCWLKKAQEVACHIVSVRSAGGEAEAADAPDNFHSCYWGPRGFDAEGDVEVRRFIEQLRTRQAAEVDWKLLGAPDYEARYLAELNAAAMGAGNAQCVIEAIQAALGVLPRTLVCRYDDAQVFKSLWSDGLRESTPGIAGTRVDWNSPDTLLVLFGGAPPDEVMKSGIAGISSVDLRGNLTAAAWAAAWRLKFSSSPACVVLLYCEPRGSDGFSARSLEAIFEGEGPEGGPFVPGVKLLRNASSDVLRKAVSLSAGRAASTPVLDVIRATLWSGLTSDREAHHAVSNLVGALLLDSEGPSKSSPQAHLSGLVRSCWEGDEPQLGYPWVTEELRGKIGTVLLVDDMAEVWKPFLRGALGLDPAVPTGDFQNVLSGLCARLRGFKERGRRFLTQEDLLGSGGKQKEFVLLLDLRLFPPGGGTDGGFYSDLARFGLELLGDSKRNLPWAPPGSEEYEGLVKCLERIRDGATSLDAPETILPRILSLLDPTLPIVIFSSAQNSNLIKPFRAYGNIVLGFHKPVLGAMARDWSIVIETLRLALSAALERAAKVLRTRRALMRLGHKALGADSQAVNFELPKPKEDCGFLVEVFFDESGRDSKSRDAICAGGVCVVRELAADGMPIISDDAIFEALDRQSCLWGWSSSGPGEGLIPERYLPKGENLNFGEKGRGLETLCRTVDVAQKSLGLYGGIFPFAVVQPCDGESFGWLNPPTAAIAAAVERHADAGLKEGLAFLLEGLMFRSEVVRRALSSAKSRLAVDLATRLIKCSTENWIEKNLGIILAYDGHRKSVEQDDGLNLFAEVYSKNLPVSALLLKSKVVRARAVKLQDFSGNPRPTVNALPEQLHYLADWIAHIYLYDRVVIEKPEIRRFFDSGWFVDFRDPKYAEDRRHPAYWRACMQGNAVEGLASASALMGQANPNGIGVDLFSFLYRSSKLLTGTELGRLFERMPQ